MASSAQWLTFTKPFCGIALDSLKKGKNITMVTLEKLCKIIGCTPNDIVEFK